jgi:hypothetical protein
MRKCPLFRNVLFSFDFFYCDTSNYFEASTKERQENPVASLRTNRSFSYSNYSSLRLPMYDFRFNPLKKEDSPKKEDYPSYEADKN